MEMLIVVAIISVLAAVLYPAVGRALDSSKSAKCLGNLRLIGAAVPNYALDNGGVLPTSAYDDPQDKETRVALQPYLLPDAPEQSHYNTLVNSIEKVNCGASVKGWGYGFNSFVSRMRMAAIEKPAQQIYAIDLYNGGRWFDISVLTWKRGDLIDATPRPHKGKVGVLFLDGHASLEKVSELTWAQATRNSSFYSPSDESQRIGRVQDDR